MSYTRPGESGQYIYPGEGCVDFTEAVVSDDAIDVFIHKLYDRQKDGDNDFWERYHHGDRIIKNFILSRVNIEKLYKHTSKTEEKAIAISVLACDILREYYTPMLGSAQVEYMLSEFLSPKKMCADIKENDYIYFTAVMQKAAMIRSVSARFSAKTTA